jgi:hypothetical protein
MGTYYGLGIVKEFTARSKTDIAATEWRDIILSRFDLDLFDTSFDHNAMSGKLKQTLFTEHVRDFFDTLEQITSDKHIDYYFDEYGDQIDNYPLETTNFSFDDSKRGKIALSIQFALLFIEGKVGAEIFSTEPKLINWLFRHADIKNPLAGAIVSDIIG